MDPTSSSSPAVVFPQGQAPAPATVSAPSGPPSTAPIQPEYSEAAPDAELIDRRRDKVQLSCTFCRRRKIKCDRQLPCQTCVSKGAALSCTYKPGPQRRGANTATVGERIRELEALVRSLLHQQQQGTQGPAGLPFTEAQTHSFGGTETPPQNISAGIGPHGDANYSNKGFKSAASVVEDESSLGRVALSPLARGTSALPSRPAPSEHGSIPRRMHSHDVNYVSSVHWAAVLDSISELKDHYEKEKEEEARSLATSDHIQPHSPGPRLLYEPVQATKAEILASIPARASVDRMVARYFNAQGVAPAFLHSGQFLREYEGFWHDPDATPLSWVALLFSIMCISTQFHQLAEDPADPETPMRAHLFRDRTIHCLMLSQFTRGGPHVLETLINNIGSEVFLSKDPDNGLWLLLGVVVQIALSMGYHRDPSNLPNMSPFTGEMRRRVWAAVVQMDLRLSSQMGLPRLLKSQHCDTAEPRNLLDVDFDEATVELPLSRPETEVTPVLYGLAKNRIDSIGGLIGDLVADTREHSYSEILDLHRKLQDAEASLPPIFRWQPISQSFMVLPQIVLYRVWLQLAIQRLVIWLHRKYLAPSYDQEQYEQSRNACVQAAIKILEFQQLVDEETRPSGQLYPVRRMQSSMIQSVFLLGMSVLCYYMQLAKTTPGVLLDKDTGDQIRGLLKNTYPMWLRSSTVSRDAREAVEHLSLLLGLGRAQQQNDDTSAPRETPSQFTSMSQDAAISHDQVAWVAYQDCIANFPVAFDADFITLDGPEPSVSVGDSAIGALFSDTAELDGWMTLKPFSGA